MLYLSAWAGFWRTILEEISRSEINRHDLVDLIVNSTVLFFLLPTNIINSYDAGGKLDDITVIVAQVIRSWRIFWGQCYTVKLKKRFTELSSWMKFLFFIISSCIVKLRLFYKQKLVAYMIFYPESFW